MPFSKNLFLIIIFVSFAGITLAQDAASEPVLKPESDADKAEKVSYPYIAEVIGTNVYIRSGAGTAYYYCGKLSLPDQVTVVGQKFGWSMILPPKGSFSWIAKKYIEIDSDNEGIGIVTGDSVRVWAGSDDIDPMRSSSFQTKLNEGDIVHLMGEEKSEYCKITPPPEARLWIKSEYLKYIGDVEKTLPVQESAIPEPLPATESAPGQTTGTKVKATEDAAPEGSITTEAKSIAECYELSKQIEAEAAKPLNKQSYKSLKMSLKSIAKDAKAGKAAFYAKYQLERIGSFEMAQMAGNEVKRQEAELRKIRDDLAKKSSATIESIPKIGEFLVSGELRQSQIYTAETVQKRYLIVNDKGRILCYAVPAKNVLKKPEKFIGKKVGLVGEFIKNSKTSISIVEFTEIKLLSCDLK